MGASNNAPPLTSPTRTPPVEPEWDPLNLADEYYEEYDVDTLPDVDNLGDHGEEIHEIPVDPARVNLSTPAPVDVTTRGRWTPSEMMQLVQARVDLEPQWDLMRGIQGANYWSTLHSQLLQQHPHFRHMQGACKIKLLRIEAQYRQIRDRMKRGGGAAVRVLPAWYTLFDTFRDNRPSVQPHHHTTSGGPTTTHTTGTLVDRFGQVGAQAGEHQPRMLLLKLLFGLLAPVVVLHVWLQLHVDPSRPPP
ncbi:unnamed protein product [Closterium sp. NIES-64]|nr:unnamed protein product [Closterium sp. NIES-64]CAI6007071.1 unnamed protein product [Closterium sp. NIES-65]